MGSVNIRDSNSGISIGPSGIKIFDNDRDMISVGPEGVIIQSNTNKKKINNNSLKTMCINGRCIGKNNNGKVRCFMLDNDYDDEDSDGHEMDCEEVKKYFKQFDVNIK